MFSFLADGSFRRVSVLFVALSILVSVAGCGSNGGGDDEELAADETSDAIAGRPGLLFDSNELPGEYYFGDGLGVNCSLTLKANHRFEFNWHGCLGTYDTNQGHWKLKGDVLVMVPAGPNRHRGFQGMNTRYVPVKWGSRIYLIEENEMPGFCAAAGRGEISERHGMHGEDYVKHIDGKLPPLEGDPVVPERFKKFVGTGPISAKVVRIDEDGNAVLDRGTADGIEPEMLLVATGYLRIEARVISAEEHTSRAEVSYYWNSDRPVSEGDLFTTGDYFSRPRGTGFERFREPPPRQAEP